MKEKIRIKCQGALALEVDELTEFQGELKSLDVIDYEKLKNEILTNGFSFPVAVWRSEGQNFILDGHQRIRTIRQMIEEGHLCPALPVVVVEADSRQQAKHKLLAAASQYGQVQDQGLYEFVADAQISADALVESFRLPEIDMPKFIAEHFVDLTAVDPADDPGVPAENEMRHASASVRQVQLFFDESTHPEFLEKSNAIAEALGKDNLTDTILEIVRQAHARLESPIC